MFEPKLERELLRIYADLDDVFASYMTELEYAGQDENALDIIEKLRLLIREVGY